MIKEKLIEAAEWLEETTAKNQAELDALGEGGIVETESRRIIHDDNFIYLYLHYYGIQVEIIYDSQLFNFLANPQKCYYRPNSKNRILIEFHRKSNSAGKKYRSMLSRFIHYYFEYGWDIDRFMEEYYEINEKSKVEKMQVDHFNDDFYNNCTWNLSLVKRELNEKKSNLLSRIKPPYYCFGIVTPTGGYRVKFGHIVLEPEGKRLIGQSVYIYCEDMPAVISFLESIFQRFPTLEELSEYLKKYGTPSYLKATYKDKKGYFAEGFESCVRVKQELSSIPDTQFIHWKDIFSWTIGASEETD